jgi:hypothetical protein
MTITPDMVRIVYLDRYDYGALVPLVELHQALAERGGYVEFAHVTERLVDADPDVELTATPDGRPALVVRRDLRGLTYAWPIDPLDDRTLVLFDGHRVGFVARASTGWSAWAQADEAQTPRGVAYGAQTLVDAARQLIPRQRSGQ